MLSGLTLDSQKDQSLKQNIEKEHLTETEVKYLATLLKMKVETCNDAPISELQDIQRKGIKTLRMQMRELMLYKAFEAIEDIYRESQEEAQMIAICLKLLLRCKRMFEAK